MKKRFGRLANCRRDGHFIFQRLLCGRKNKPAAPVS